MIPPLPPEAQLYYTYLAAVMQCKKEGSEECYILGGYGPSL